MSINLILLDADDTLWHNMRHFDAAERAFTELIGTFADAGIARETLSSVEERNLHRYGYGAKSFTLSMIEAALELGGKEVASSTIKAILKVGQELLDHPVELLGEVADTIEALAGLGELVLVTKGDLLHQETKLAASGLGSYFAAVEIVSDKTVGTFQRIFDRRGVAPDQAIMAGDSLRSDILPALASGAWAAFVPQPLAWSHEHAPEPVNELRYRRLTRLSELPSLIGELGRLQRLDQADGRTV